jgi:hypothetical protein
MGISLGTIITIILILWGVIQVVVQASAKKKEQERLAQLARRRREEAALAARLGAQGSPGSPTPHARAEPQAAMPAAPPSALEELRRRRAAQLEDLRRRKQQADARKTQVRITPGGATAPPVTQLPSRRATMPPAVLTGRSQPTRTRPAMQPVQRAPRPLVTPSRAAPVPVAPSFTIDGTAEGPVAPLVQTAPPPVRAQKRKQPRIDELGLTRGSIRRAIILKELLDPPIALRAPN